MKKISISISIVLLTGCSLSPSPKIEVDVDPLVVEVQEDSFVCGRDKVKDADGNEYKTAYFDVDGGHDVTKEGQCWMAENLNVGTVTLNPDQEPSDDGVIEKWCLNRFEGHTPSPFHNTERSDITYCDGLDIPQESGLSTSVHKEGGLYSWSEIQNNTKVCPEGWNIPFSEDWEYLIERIDLDYEHLSSWIHENEGSIKVFEVGGEEFPIKNIGYRTIRGEYESNNIYAPVYFWMSFVEPSVISFSYGETSAWFGPTKRRVKDGVGASVRCVKSQNKKDILSNNQIDNILKGIEEIFSVAGNIPEMQNIPTVPSRISKEQYYSLIYTFLLKFRLLHIYDDLEVLVKFQQDEFIRISQNEYVIPLLLFQREENDSSLEFLTKFFVTIQVRGENDWIISNIECVNIGQGGRGSMYTKYEEKKTQRDGEKITSSFQLIEKNELQKRLKSLYETREDDKKTYLESLNQKRPMYLHREEDVFVCGRDTVKDTDGNEYKTAYFDVDGGHDVTKEGQCWMAENLNVGTVILNPDQEPSDDGVIEKWCMTSDERAIAGKNPHCFAGGGGGPGGEGLVEAKQRLKCNSFGSSSPSDERLCDGREGYEKYGGLYSFNELKNNRDYLCPEGWKVPNLNDWEVFFQQQKESMRIDGEFHHNAEKYREQAWDDMYFDGMETDPFGLEYFDRDRKAIYKHVEKNDIHNYCVSEEMRYGEFAVKMGGKLWAGNFMGRGNETCFWALRDKYILKTHPYNQNAKICLATWQGGNPYANFYVDIIESRSTPTFYNTGSGNFVRCIKK